MDQTLQNCLVTVTNVDKRKCKWFCTYLLSMWFSFIHKNALPVALCCGNVSHGNKWSINIDVANRSRKGRFLVLMKFTKNVILLYINYENWFANSNLSNLTIFRLEALFNILKVFFYLIYSKVLN